MVTYGHAKSGTPLSFYRKGSLLFEHLPSARKVCGAALENFNALDIRAEIGERSMRWSFVPERERVVD